ncbi:MAG: hypothetical protein H6Q72_2350 [Firmicutes bacterium]|nr:hypothetical protein [Bacillota bacterium]
MVIDGVKVTADSDITDQEIRDIVAEELKLWKRRGKDLASVQLSIQDDEIEVKAIERSPIKRIRRITGYLSTEDRFNASKQSELLDRVSHM